MSWVVRRLRAFLNEGDNLTKTRWAFVLAALTAGGSFLAALSTFAAKLKLAGLPWRFAKRPIGEVVKFDAAAQQQVTLEVGGQEIRNQIPGR